MKLVKKKKARWKKKVALKANKTGAKTANSHGKKQQSTPGAPKAAGTNPKRVAAILRKLDEAYPEAICELKHGSPFELLIATILSAQCTDVRVNQVTETLFKKYRNPQAFAYATPSDLETEIRPTGFFRNKTKSIMRASKELVEKFHGEVPRDMNELLTLPGVARKTANVVLGTAYGIASGVVVDTHVIRLTQRLDLTRNEDPKKIEQEMMEIIPKDRWIKFSHQLIWHGRRVCYARKPNCAQCNLESICYSGDKTI
jgi:endonuclease-3